MTRVRSVRSCDAVTETESAHSLGAYGAASPLRRSAQRHQATIAHARRVRRRRRALREARPPPRASPGASNPVGTWSSGGQAGATSGRTRPPATPGRDAAHRQRAHDRHGEEVGGERGERHRAEDRDQHRRHPDLRGGGDAQRLGSHRGPGRRATMAGASTAMPALAPQDSRKPSEWTRNGSASTQHDDGEGEDAQAGGRTAEVHRGHRARRHHARPQHRRLPPGHRPEQHEDDDAGDQLAAEPAAGAAAGRPAPTRTRRWLPTRRAGA